MSSVQLEERKPHLLRRPLGQAWVKVAGSVSRSCMPMFVARWASGSKGRVPKLTTNEMGSVHVHKDDMS